VGGRQEGGGQARGCAQGRNVLLEARGQGTGGMFMHSITCIVMFMHSITCMHEHDSITGGLVQHRTITHVVEVWSQICRRG
jgi:hypothetical protein